FSVNTSGAVVANQITIPNLGLLLTDPGGSHTLTIKPGFTYSTSRVFTLTTDDASRTLTVNGNSTINQNVSTTGTPAFVGLTTGAGRANIQGYLSVSNATVVITSDTDDLVLPSGAII